MTMTSSRPYLIRALYEWIVDNQLTPHLLVNATMPGVSVPEKHIRDGKIVLNIAPEAIMQLNMTNEWVNFEARFSGVPYQIRLPVMSIEAIYAMENGRGMVFEHELTDHDQPPPVDPNPSKSDKKGVTRPSLKVVK